MQAIVSSGLLTGLVSVGNFYVPPFQGGFFHVAFLGDTNSHINNFSQNLVFKNIIYDSKTHYITSNLRNDNYKEEFENILLNLQITSDSQFWEQENIFFAEGNVNALINGAKLKADKLKVDQLNKTLVASGNVIFINGSNYFSASHFEYNLDKKKGRLDNVYGVIDIKMIPKDLNLLESKENRKEENENDDKSTLREVKLQDGFTLEGSLDPEMKILSSNEIKKNSINRWRLKASNIFIFKNGWRAREVSFTNDPFNPAQSRIDAYKVELIELDEGRDNYVLTAKKSYLVLEDKIKIPIRNRKISKQGLEDWKRFEKWILGIDGQDRDGIFIGRQLSPIKLPFDYSWSIQPQFLLQRSIEGKTNSYPLKGQAFNSKKVLSDTDFEDNFGLESEIIGKTFTWDTNISSSISTFNADRFADGSRHSINFSKEIKALRIKDIKANLFGEYRYNMYEIWDDSRDNNDIYTAYGFKLDKKGTFNSDKIKSNYALRTGVGQYRALQLNGSKLINRYRSDFNGRLDSKYPLIYFDKKEPIEYIRPSNSPKVITPSLYLNSLITSSNYIYQGGERQFLIGFGLGPELTIGSFSRNYFDYTNISILPTITFKSGESPFEFDNKEDLVTLKFIFSQHIVGPLLIKTINEWNIDSGSDNYGDVISAKAAIMLQRRAYELGLFYDIENQSGGVSFSLNGFGFKGIPNPF